MKADDNSTILNNMSLVNRITAIFVETVLTGVINATPNHPAARLMQRADKTFMPAILFLLIISF